MHCPVEPGPFVPPVQFQLTPLARARVLCGLFVLLVKRTRRVCLCQRKAMESVGWFLPADLERQLRVGAGGGVVDCMVLLERKRLAFVCS